MKFYLDLSLIGILLRNGSRLLVLCALLVASFNFQVQAQGTVQDYKRAEGVRILYKDKVYNAPSSFNWLKNKHFFWYLNRSQSGNAFLLVNADKQTQQVAFDHAKLAKAVALKLGKKINEHDLPFKQIDFSDDMKSISFQVDSAKLKYELKSGQCVVVDVVKPGERNEKYWGNQFDEKGNAPVKSPDSLWIAYIKDNNLFIQSRTTKIETQLSYDGSEGNFYSSYMQWSPDSKKIVAYRFRPGQKRMIYFVESSPSDQLQPKLQSREYLKPGDALPHKQPQLFLIDEKKHVSISDDQFKNQYFLEEIKWAADSRSFTFEYNERGHQRYQVFQVAVPSGEPKVIIDETSKTFIDYSGKRYRYDLKGDKEIIWASERDGWNHLYLYQKETGKANQITKGKWVVREVIQVNEEKRTITFKAAGLDADQDPYQTHYCIINFDGSGMRRLTTSNAQHELTFSDDYTYFVDRSSRPDLPPVCSLHLTETAAEKMMIQRADISALQLAGWKMPEVFSAKGRDGVTDIWGVMIRPSNFDPQKKYPIIEMVYAGPQSFYVQKSFNTGYFGLHALAELGFIVVQVDGMGTSWRSKAFHDVCFKNLKDAGFLDRISWIKALATKYTYLDTTNVGIFGGSAGGQNAASAVMLHGDFYAAAVASCGSHDNRVDKIWWNEQWMGYPVGPEYAASSNVTNAHKLNGALLLIVGELDDNVDPASTLQVADALIKAKKNFELVIVPGMGHSGGGEFGERKRRDFFVKYLLHVEPPDWEASYPDK